MKKLRTAVTALALATSVAACGTINYAERYVPGEDPTYKAAFNHGCISGNLAGGINVGPYQKDRQWYKTSETYKAGWDDAYDFCKSDAQATMAILNGS